MGETSLVLRVRVCGGLEVEADGQVLPDGLVGGRQGRLVLAYLLCERARAVRREELAELLWADRLPESWPASLSAVISRLRRLLSEAGLDGAEAIASSAGAYRLVLPDDASVDLDELVAAVRGAEAAAAGGDVSGALEAAAVAEAIGARGFLVDDAEWVDRQRTAVRDLRVRAALARAVAHRRGGSAARAVEAARDALALDDTREASYRELMSSLAAAGERAEALRVWERCRTTLVEELGVDPSPETEAVYREVLGEAPAAAMATATSSLPSGVVTFLLTDIVGSSTLWDEAPQAMVVALERHDALVAEVVGGHGGTLLKSKLEGDATVSVFARASDGVAAALALRGALDAEPWPAGAALRLRMALHTGEAFERGGDYFGPALNRAARLRALGGEQDVLLSQAVTELVRDHLPPHARLRDLGHRDLRGMARGEHVYALDGGIEDRADGDGQPGPRPGPAFVPPALPVPLTPSGPFVGRADELQRLVERWREATTGSSGAVFVGGEPGVGKSRLAAELAAHAHAAGAVVLHGRCDEDLAAALHPFVEALRPLVPALGPGRTASVRGVDELARVLPELGVVLPARGPAVRADPDTERLALFDAFASLLRATSAECPVLLVLDDLHWAGKTTLSLLRHLLREAAGARLLVVGTYRDTELARSHPLAETLADLRRDGATARVPLGGLASADVDAYLEAVGIDDRALGRELAEITSGNPYFLIEVVRHVEEVGGTWSIGDLPEGVREATGRRLSRLAPSTNRALSVAAVAGTSFDLALVEQIEAGDLLDEIAEACHAGLVVEEPGAGGRFRFAHAIVRQVLLAELVTIKRARLHRQIAELLDAAPVVGDPDARLADLAYHWSECASLGDADRAVDACRRAAERAVARLAYEEAGDLYAMAIQVLDATDDLDAAVGTELHLARCAALLAGGDVPRAREAVDALAGAAPGSERVAAWYSTYAGLLAVLAEPDRLPEIVRSIGAAADAMRALGDLRGEAQAHYVHATALERLGRIGAAERVLDAALAAARNAEDRGLADSILAEAPLAALWGPSSVTRASGRCLDVVRVLRINGGAPAVESVAIRCQAVLEGLRGRADAARRMVGSAKRTAERLGLTHRRLEAEVAAGLIELLDGRPSEAEALLRPAHRSLRERGLDGEAAQAAAFLGRALLVQGRVDDAEAVAVEAAALAGADLKAGIAWRGVRAECAALRGDAELARRLAGEAVDLAAATDALLLVADARLALAAVLRTLGEDARADDEARRALEACTAKGATALAARVGVAPSTARATDGFDDGQRNVAVVAARRIQEALEAGDLDELATRSLAGVRVADRRQEPTVESAAPDLRRWHHDGVRLAPPQLLLAHGARAALLRWDLLGLGPESPALAVVAVDDAGRVTDWTLFDVGGRRAANVELERLVPSATDADTSAWRGAARMATAANERDWEGYVAALAPTSLQRDRRHGYPDEDSHLDQHQILFRLDDVAYERTAVAHHGDRRVLSRDVIWFRDGAVEDAEITTLQLVEVDDAGLVTSQTSYGVDELEAALAALHAGDEEVRSTSAWRAVERLVEAVNAHDWDALLASLAPGGGRDRTRRRSIRAPMMDGQDPIAAYRTLFSLDDWSIDLTPIDRHGDRRVLARYVTRFRDGAVAASETESLVVFEADAEGRVASQMTFVPDDLDAALAELHAGDEEVRETSAWRALERLAGAVNDHDWDALLACLAPGYAVLDRRRGVTAPDGTDPVAVYRVLFSLDDWSMAVTPIDRHGDRRILARYLTRFRDGAAAESEVESIVLLDVDGEGRLARQTTFAPDDLDAALAALHADAPGAPAGEGNAAWRASLAFRRTFDARDWDALLATVAEGFELDDRRSGVRLRETGEAALDLYRTAFGLDRFTWDGTLLATRGDHLALVRDRASFADRHAGAAEVVNLSIVESGPDGRLRRLTTFDDGDLAGAMEELERRAVEPVAGAPVGNAAWVVSLAQEAAAARRDWDAFAATLHDDYEYVERRRAMWMPPDAPADSYARTMFGLDDWQFERTLLATRGHRLALFRQTCRFHDGATGPAEATAAAVLEVAPDGRLLRETAFDLDDLASAREELDRRLGEDDEERHPAAAVWQLALRQQEAADRRSWDDFAATLHPSFEVDDRRRTISLPAGAPPDSQYRTMFALDDWRFERTLLATRGDRLALVRTTCRFHDGATGPAESTAVTILEVAEDGRLRRETPFDPDDLDAARAELDARAVEAVRPNLVWLTLVALWDAFDRRDWDGWVARHLPEQVQEHRQVGNAHVLAGPEAFASNRVLWEMDQVEVERRLLATAGERVALVRFEVRGSDGAAGPFEYLAVNVVEVAEDGRIARQASFDLEELGAALAHLHERGAAVAPAPNAASVLVRAQEDAFRRRDWDGFRAGLGPGFTVESHQRAIATRFDEAQSVASVGYAFDLPDLRWHRHLVATRGDHLALTRDELVSGLESGEVDYEIASLTLVELDADELVGGHVVFDVDDLPAAVDLLDRRAAARETGAG